MTAGAGTVKVTVLDGWAVYDGTAQRSGGATVEVDPDTAEQWLAAGWVEKTATPRKRK